MVTRKDVAELAGVSPSTVSYVISGKRSISPETRDRVEQVMRDLDYTPNANARSLAGARNGIIALHFPSGHSGPNTTEFDYLNSIAQRARDHGYHMLLWSGDIEDLDALQGLVRSQLVDGVLLMEVRMEDPRIPMLEASGIPFALLGRPADPSGLVCVDDDFDMLGAQAIDHLADLGHRDVLYLAQSEDYLNAGHGPSLRTLAALTAAAQRRGLRLRYFHAEHSVTAGERALNHVRALSPRPTAVVAFNELAVAGLLRAAITSGISVPSDLTVVGLNFPDTVAEILNPTLTTVAPSPAALGEAATDALVGLIAGSASPNRQQLLQPSLKVRESSAPPRQ